MPYSCFVLEAPLSDNRFGKARQKYFVVVAVVVVAVKIHDFVTQK